jgi:hypothetical protein
MTYLLAIPTLLLLVLLIGMTGEMIGLMRYGKD